MALYDDKAPLKGEPHALGYPSVQSREPNLKSRRVVRTLHLFVLSALLVTVLHHFTYGGQRVAGQCDAVHKKKPLTGKAAEKLFLYVS